MAEVASAYVSLLPSAKGFGAKLDGQISGDVQSSGKKLGSSWGKVFGIAAGLGIGAKAISFLGDSLGEAREAQVVGQRTASVIKSMGGAANISAKGVSNLAGAISAKTGIDDEAIQSGQNMLLTFGNVRNETGKGNRIFSQASQLMVDMSTAMGTDAKGSAIQLGKALNDPIKGTAALGRVGVQFTADQKEAIKTMVESGDTLGAQKTILKELTKQFGGAAASMATPADKAKVAWGNLKEQIGTAVLPVVDKVTRTFTKDVVPAISTFVEQIQTGEGAGGDFRDAFTQAKDAVTKVIGVVKDIVGFLNQHRTAVIGVTTAVVAGVAAYKAFMVINAVMAAVKTGIVLFKAWRAGTLAMTAAQLGLNGALIANPIGIVVALVAGLAAGLIIAYKKSDTFRKIVDKAFSVVKAGGVAMWEGGIKPALAAMKTGFEAVGRAGTWLWNKALQPAFKFIVNGIASILDLWSSMLSTLAKVPGFGWAKKAADAMAGAADQAREMADGIKKIPSRWTVTITTSYITRNRGKEQSMGDDFLPRVNGRGNSPSKAFAQVLAQFGQAGKQLMDRITTGIKTAKPKTVAAAQDAFDALKRKLESKRDDLRSTLDGFLDDFAAIKDAVSGAFAGDLFSVSASDGKTVGQNFIENLMGKKAELAGLLASFKTLQGWGVSPAFLTQLFSSGNGALITELAGMGQSGALSTSSLFGDVTNLGQQLGNSVASNDQVATRIDETNRLLTLTVDALSYLGSDIGKELNQAAAQAHRDKKNRGKGKK